MTPDLSPRRLCFPGPTPPSRRAALSTTLLILAALGLAAPAAVLAQPARIQVTVLDPAGAGIGPAEA